MSNDIIQTQIKLTAFKATKVTFECIKSEITKENTIDLKLDLKDLTFVDNPKLFVKVFYLNVKAQNKLLPELVNINIEYHTVFECAENIDEIFLNSDFAKISAPAIGFPHLRAFVTSITSQAGIAPLILPSINFIQYQNNLSKVDVK